MDGVKTSLEAWAAAWSFRTGYRLHVTILLGFILSQPPLAYHGICEWPLSVITMLVNMPMIVGRLLLHQWDDAEYAQRFGAPSLVAYMLLKPAIIMGIGIQLFGTKVLPQVTVDLVNIMESFSPLLLMLDGLMLSTLGLSVRMLVVATIFNVASIWFGATCAVPDLQLALSVDAPVKVSNTSLGAACVGFVSGSILGRVSMSSLAERASEAEWARRIIAARRLDRPRGASGESGGSGGGAGGSGGKWPGFGNAPTSTQTPYDSSASDPSLPPDAPEWRASGAHDDVGAGMDMEIRSYASQDQESLSTIQDFLQRNGDLDDYDHESVISQARSGRSDGASTTARLAEWEAAREVERAKERASELLNSIYTRFSSSRGVEPEKDKAE